ncbi:MAG: hypothetical protein F4Y44_02110 [Chloroflexi bacterium]|nr:hypothetical protein [Chloroflexota bacterium]
MTTLEHTRTAQELLAKSDKQFAAGEYREGSKTLWRAAEIAMTAVAEQRGWKHSDYKELLQAGKLLAQEQGNKSIYTGFGAARLFYDNSRFGFLEDYELDAFAPPTHDFINRMLSLME